MGKLFKNNTWEYQNGKILRAEAMPEQASIIYSFSTVIYENKINGNDQRRRTRLKTDRRGKRMFNSENSQF